MLVAHSGKSPILYDILRSETRTLLAMEDMINQRSRDFTISVGLLR